MDTMTQRRRRPMRTEGCTFENESVDLDGNEFIDCTFLNCTLHYRGGALPMIIGCSFDRPTFDFRGAAENTKAFLTALLHGGFRHFVEDTFDTMRTSPPREKPLIHSNKKLK